MKNTKQHRGYVGWISVWCWYILKFTLVTSGIKQLWMPVFWGNWKLSGLTIFLYHPKGKFKLWNSIMFLVLDLCRSVKLRMSYRYNEKLSGRVGLVLFSHYRSSTGIIFMVSFQLKVSCFSAVLPVVLYVIPCYIGLSYNQSCLYAIYYLVSCCVMMIPSKLHYFTPVYNNNHWTLSLVPKPIRIKLLATKLHISIQILHGCLS